MVMSVSLGDIRRVSRDVLKYVNVPDDHQDIIIESIVYAHARRKGTHGLGRLLIYVDKISNGLMDSTTPIEILKDRKATALLNANHGFGQVAAAKGMDLAIEKAERFGIAAVAVRASNNFGTVGYITERAAARGMVGMVFTNSSPALAPIGGKKPIVGTNPLGIAFPSGESGTLISLDMATSAAARGKIRLAAKEGRKIPLGWALNQEGCPTDDPLEALKGSMVPVGDHKGFGLALCIDVLAGLISGAGFAGHVLPLSSDKGYSDYGHFLIVIDPSFFLEEYEYKTKVDYLIEQLKSTDPTAQVRIPGDYRINLSDMSLVEVSDKVISEINEFASTIGFKGFESV